MKKLLALVLILFLALSCCFSLSADLHLGLLSGIGTEHKLDKWTFGADIEGSFPVYSIVQGIAGEEFDDLDFREGFKLGIFYFSGLNLSSYWSFYSNSWFSASVGADLILGTEIPIKNFEMVFKPGLRFDFKTGEKTSLFVIGDYPLLDLSFAKGFDTPYVRLPKVNYASVLTGCRFGLSYKFK